MKSIGTFDAKTHLPRLLERVSRGERIMITKHGKPIAMLVPPAAESAEVADILAQMRELRRGNKLEKGVTVRDLIAEGRRF